ncbi:sensor histidine kinase [Trichlorobacter lovleyi]|uniref:sensor histidine kinase n=1 Tax=Trichlorobacter lovleyi TaxID=313985 RepID=UPI0023F18B91|nr:HAMP domain-containing sensor histidine kinase [Trichlorobacter lovleyi]
MAFRIPDTLWSRLAALMLLVALAGLSSALLVRQLIISDFRKYMDAKMVDRTYGVMARLEGRYAEAGRWEPSALSDDLIWASMMGLNIRVRDAEDRILLDMNQALQQLSPVMRQRVLSYSRDAGKADLCNSTRYPLFHQGQQIGELEVSCANPNKELLFIAHTNRLLLISLVTVGAISLLISYLLARRITDPLKRLTNVAGAMQAGDMTVRVPQEEIAEFRTMADTFNRLADALASQETLRKRLLTNAAHELRTPLTVMRLQVESMADGIIPATPERMNALLADLDRFKRILGALDDLSQAEASASQLQYQTISLRSFLEHIVEQFVTAEQNVAFFLAVPNEQSLYADPERLSQIVINLLTNAVKAVNHVGRITLRAEKNADSIQLCIEDSGCGIAPEDLSHIFERFYRSFDQGMGVGLAIVKELTEAHGATITASNLPSGGACFCLTFPA